MGKRQWADKYGSRWYLHYDGQPPHDDDNSYVWTGSEWAVDYEYEDACENALEEYEARRREKLAIKSEY